MRDRRIQRALKKLGVKREEPIDILDYCGVYQKTPKEAIDRLIFERRELVRKLKELEER